MVEQWVLRIFGSSHWELSNSSSAETSASSEVCSVYVRTIWQMPDWTVTNFNFVLCRITKQICIHAADTHFLLLHLISNSSSFQSAQASSPQVRSKYSPFYKRQPRGHCFASTYFQVGLLSQIISHWRSKYYPALCLQRPALGLVHTL